MLYYIYLWIERKRRNYFRRVFKRGTPHWLKALPVRYVNFLSMYPTLVCIVLCPDKFFRKLDLILDGKDHIHKSPIEFVCSFVAFERVFLGDYYLDRWRDDYIDAFSNAFPCLDFVFSFSNSEEFIVYYLVISSSFFCYFINSLILAVTFFGQEQESFIAKLRGGNRNIYFVSEILDFFDPKSFRGISYSKLLWGLVYLSVPILLSSFTISCFLYLLWIFVINLWIVLETFFSHRIAIYLFLSWCLGVFLTIRKPLSGFVYLYTIHPYFVLLRSTKK